MEEFIREEFLKDFMSETSASDMVRHLIKLDDNHRQ